MQTRTAMHMLSTGQTGELTNTSAPIANNITYINSPISYLFFSFSCNKVIYFPHRDKLILLHEPYATENQQKPNPKACYKC
jgi:hypothetical protein